VHILISTSLLPFLHSECLPYDTLFLNIRSPRFCFSVGNRRHFLSDVLLWYHHKQWRGLRRNASCKIIFWPIPLCVSCVCVHRTCLSHVGAVFTMRALDITQCSICSISRMNMYINCLPQRKKVVKLVRLWERKYLLLICDSTQLIWWSWR